MSIQSIPKSSLRRAILDTSRHMLVSEGFNRLSMRRIAAEVGCSATSIYLYFENKDALLHALIDEGFELFYTLIRTTVKAGDPAEKKLETLCLTFIDFGLSNPEYYEIMFLIHPANITRFPVENFRRARRPVNMLIDTLNEGSEAGLFETENPGLTAHVIWSALHGAVTAILTNRMDAGIGRKQFIDAVITHMMRSISSGNHKNGSGRE